MLTSTLISPNAIKMLLPQSTSGQTMAKQNVTVSIDANLKYYVENQEKSLDELEGFCQHYFLIHKRERLNCMQIKVFLCNI